jgi:hypothetical protein
MRSSRWLFIAVFVSVALLAASDAQAYGCWVCDNQYDSCLYYRDQDRIGCNAGCDTMYPNNLTARTNCKAICTSEWNTGRNTCYTDQNECLDGCERPELPPRDNCPIVLDLGSNGWDFTSAAEGVSFDIDADGHSDPIAWTAAGAADGFLIWDRNGNGSVDDGRELFGDATPQAESATPNGFAALAAFDLAQFGGNGDGVISSLDGIFAALQVWVDADHDGVSSAGELSSLASHGVVSIDLDVKESRRKDRHGNELRYRARVQRDGGTSDAIDVFFQRQQ